MRNIIALAAFCLLAGLPATVQAQDIFLKPGTSSGESTGKTLFLPQSSGSGTSAKKSNAPLFLDQEYGEKVGRITYNPYETQKHKFSYGHQKKETMSADDKVTLSLMNTDIANFENAAKENQRLQAQAAADIARVEAEMKAQQAAYSNTPPAGLSRADKAFYESLGLPVPETLPQDGAAAENAQQSTPGEPAEKKKTVINYDRNSLGLSAPKPVFNSVR